MNPFVDNPISQSALGLDFIVNIKNFWLLLPDYAVLVMLKLFPFSLLLTLIFIFIIIWTSNKILHIQTNMHKGLILASSADERVENSAPKAIINQKWHDVIIHINSENPNDWKLAILECDIILGEMLEKMGYMQNSIGEKLKAVEPSDFTNIESAWEAHKIRNSIAHEGSDFAINEREAKRVIGLYEVVFREFDFI